MMHSCDVLFLTPDPSRHARWSVVKDGRIVLRDFVTRINVLDVFGDARNGAASCVLQVLDWQRLLMIHFLACNVLCCLRIRPCV